MRVASSAADDKALHLTALRMFGIVAPLLVAAAVHAARWYIRWWAAQPVRDGALKASACAMHRCVRIYVARSNHTEARNAVQCSVVRRYIIPAITTVAACRFGACARIR